MTLLNSLGVDERRNAAVCYWKGYEQHELFCVECVHGPSVMQNSHKIHAFRFVFEDHAFLCALFLERPVMLNPFAPAEHGRVLANMQANVFASRTRVILCVRSPSVIWVFSLSAVLGPCSGIQTLGEFILRGWQAMMCMLFLLGEEGVNLLAKAEVAQIVFWLCATANIR